MKKSALIIAIVILGSAILCHAQEAVMSSEFVDKINPILKSKDYAEALRLIDSRLKLMNNTSDHDGYSKLRDLQQQVTEAESQHSFNEQRKKEMEEDLIRRENLAIAAADRKKKEEQSVAEHNIEIERIRVAKETERIVNDKKRSDLERCQALDQYKLFKTQEDIIDYFMWINKAKEDIKSENEIAKVSGYTNKYNRYVSGSNIVENKKLIKEAWPEYKRLGGKAKSPDKIKHTVKDPCIDLEAQTQNNAY